MISPWDEDYAQTKLVKQGKRALPAVFKELAEWVADAYPDVTVLNIYYDKITIAHKVLPRLNLIFETEEEKNRFQLEPLKFDPAKQAAVATQLGVILANHGDKSFDTSRLLVIFTAFETVAREEAISTVTAKEMAELETKLSDPAIWMVRKTWGGIGIFFHTNAQLARLGDDAFRAKWSKAFAETASPHDEFGYLRDHPADVTLDSKENFDKKFHGNWFFYDR